MTEELDLRVHRKIVRHQLAEILKAATSGIVSSVYPSQQDLTEKETPVIRFMSKGSLRPKMTMGGGRATFYYTLQVLVLFEDVENSWTPDKAEDRLDDIEYEIAKLTSPTALTLFFKGTKIKGFTFDRPSNAFKVEINGQPYLSEYYSTIVEVY